MVRGGRLGFRISWVGFGNLDVSGRERKKGREKTSYSIDQLLDLPIQHVPHNLSARDPYCSS